MCSRRQSESVVLTDEAIKGRDEAGVCEAIVNGFVGHFGIFAGTGYCGGALHLKVSRGYVAIQKDV